MPWGLDKLTDNGGTPQSRVKLFLRIMAVSLTVMVVFVALAIEIWVTAISKDILRFETSNVNLVASLTTRDLQKIIGDLVLLSRITAFENFARNPSAANRLQLIDEMKDLASTTRQYAKLRVLDLNGRELIRLNYHRGQVEIVPEDQLQPKDSRYFVIDAMKLNPGEVYLSPLDLDADNGRLKTPYIPALRVAMPFFRDGKKAGLLILNAPAAEVFSRLLSDDRIPINKMIVDNHGQWLYNHDTTQLWGSVLKERARQKLSLQNPELWTHVISSPRGVFHKDTSNFIYSTITLRPVVPNITRIVTDDSYPWHVVYQISRSSLYYSARELIYGLAVLSLILLLWGGAVVWLYLGRREQIVAAQNAAADTLMKLKSVLDSATEVGIFAVDRKGLFTTFSKGAEIMLGYKESEVVARYTPGLIFTRAEQERLAEDLGANTYNAQDICDSFIARGAVDRRDMRVVRKDGTEFTSRAVVSPMRDNSGRVIGMLTVMYDISAELEVQQQLVRAKEMADEASRAKSEFLASMSHEIRTPLNSIIGFTDILLGMHLPSEQQRLLKTIEGASDSLLYIINDILDLSKIEAKKLELETMSFDPRQLAEGVCEMFAFRAAEKNIELICDIAPDVDMSVVGDANRVRQILINLLGNALKFTHEGHIILSLSVRSSADAKVRLRFTVADTGIGIPEKDRARLFHKFTQVDSSVTRRYGGTGLGLSISRSLAELMGGAITLETAEGHGSVFAVDIPFDPVPDLPRACVYAGAMSSACVLVAAASPQMRSACVNILSCRGIQCEETASEREALGCLTTSPGKFSAVLTDYALPDGSGIELARAARSLLAPEARIVLAVPVTSARMLKENFEPAVSTVLTKPLRQAELISAVTGVPVPSAHSSAPKQEKPAVALRVLLAEDNPSNQAVIGMMLSEMGYNYDLAENGRVALEMWQKYKYDAILMDVQMPELDGNTATSLLREAERAADLPRIPVIALTAHAFTEDRQKSLAAGADDYITKPLKKAVLGKALSDLIRPRVLIADDAEDNRNLMRVYLKGETGVEIIFAADGREALDYIAGHSVGLVFMDLEMPGMNGREAIEALRKRTASDRIKIPVVALSGYSAAEQQKMSPGCAGYLEKPIKKDVLIATLRRFTSSAEV